MDKLSGHLNLQINGPESGFSVCYKGVLSLLSSYPQPGIIVLKAHDLALEKVQP
jgi:hypothetical protein